MHATVRHIPAGGSTCGGASLLKVGDVSRQLSECLSTLPSSEARLFNGSAAEQLKVVIIDQPKLLMASAGACSSTVQLLREQALSRAVQTWQLQASVNKAAVPQAAGELSLQWLSHAQELPIAGTERLVVVHGALVVKCELASTEVLEFTLCSDGDAVWVS